MPYRLWRHVCEGREVSTGSPDCHVCGAHGVFAGWRLSMYEAMRLYRYVYELEPVGPHRRRADRLLTPMRTRCIRCRGEGLLTIDVTAWSTCPSCEGTGGIWNRSTEEIAAVRRKVLAPQPPRRPGYSSHGLRFTDVEGAFAAAEQLLGTSWHLKGRGHCRRASLNAHYSSHALKGAARSWTRVRPHQALTWKRLMPVALIEKAAELLGVPARLLMAREY